MRRIKGRYDDMLIVRGVNLYPSEVERVVLEFDELAPHYQLVLRRERALDDLEVQAEVHESYAASLGVPWPDRPDEHPSLSSLTQRIAAALFGATALNVSVALRPPGSVPRSEGKAVRVVDQREEPHS
jgi:phenylacetate-CoA ligase